MNESAYVRGPSTFLCTVYCVLQRLIRPLNRRRGIPISEEGVSIRQAPWQPQKMPPSSPQKPPLRWLSSLNRILPECIFIWTRMYVRLWVLVFPRTSVIFLRVMDLTSYGYAESHSTRLSSWDSALRIHDRRYGGTS